MPTEPQLVAAGLRFPEGPVWVPATDSSTARLLCTSVADGTVVEIDLATGTLTTVATVGGGANAALLASDGGVLVTQNGGIDFAAAGLPGAPAFRPVRPGIQRVSAAGAVSSVAPVPGGEDLLAPNDLVCGTDGTLWFTDPPHHPPPEEPVGRVHTMTPDGTTEWIVERLGATPGDGFCVDVDGRLYVAVTGDHGIRVLEPDGTEVELLEIPGNGITTNCCFGGDDLRTLFATDGLPGTVMAWEGMPTPGLALTPWPVPRAMRAR